MRIIGLHPPNLYSAGIPEQCHSAMPAERSPITISELSERIRSHILDKGYTAGTKIETEEELAELFGVSRYKIRTVLGALVQQGVLTKSPRRGTYVNEFNPLAASENLLFQYRVREFDLNEFIEARIVIEQAIIPLVIRRITPVQITKLNEAINQMVERKYTPKQADAADQEFHLKLIRSAGNELLSSFSSVVTLLFHREEYRSRYWDPETVERLANEHRLILEAIADGDEKLTLQRHGEHLNIRGRVGTKRHPGGHCRR